MAASDPTDLINEFKEESAQYIAARPELAKALEFYTGTGFNTIRHYIQTGSGKKPVSISILDEGLANAPILPKPITVYHGAKSSAFSGAQLFPDKEKGEEITSPYYRSTTLDPEITNRYLDASSGRVECCVAAITIPKGFPALFVQSVSQHPSEEEVLLPRGTKLLLLDRGIEKGILVWKWQVVGYDKSPLVPPSSFSPADEAIRQWQKTIALAHSLSPYLSRFQKNYLEQLEDNIEAVKKGGEPFRPVDSLIEEGNTLQNKLRKGLMKARVKIIRS